MAGEREGRRPREPALPDLHVRRRSELGRIDDTLRILVASMDRLQGLLDAVVAISREVQLPAVLHLAGDGHHHGTPSRPSAPTCCSGVPRSATHWTGCGTSSA